MPPCTTRAAYTASTTRAACTADACRPGGSNTRTIGGARGRDRAGVTTNATVATIKADVTIAAVTAGATGRVRSIAWVAIRWRDCDCRSARPTIGARSADTIDAVNAGGAEYI
ncbi:MAG: hypothetical protein ABSF34_22735 [Verrucomicrobiota bacterium]